VAVLRPQRPALTRPPSRALSSQIVTKFGAGRPALFFRVDGNKVAAVLKGARGWTEAPAVIDGSVEGDVAAAQTSDGPPMVVALGGAKAVVQYSVKVKGPKMDFKPWASLEGEASSAPVAVAQADGRIVVLVRGSDKVTYYSKTQVAPGWEAGFQARWDKLGAP
jgi:hypothetical protein